MQTNISHLLVPLDGSCAAEMVLAHAVALARTLGGKITLLCVLEGSEGHQRAHSPPAPLSWQLRQAEAEAYLSKMRLELQPYLPHTEIEVALEAGPPAKRIVEFAAAHGADMVLLCSHGQGGPAPWNLGSVSLKVVLHSHTSVMLVRAFALTPTLIENGGACYRRVLVPLDGSVRGEAALALASSCADANGGEIVLAQLVGPLKSPDHGHLSGEQQAVLTTLRRLARDEAQTYLDSVREHLRPTPLSVRTRVQVSDSLIALHDLTDEMGVDLTVMTAHGQSGVRRWPLGRVAMNLLIFGNTPLLLLQDVKAHDLGLSVSEQATLELAGH